MLLISAREDPPHSSAKSQVAARFRKALKRALRTLQKELPRIHRRRKVKAHHSFRLAMKQLRVFVPILKASSGLLRMNKLWKYSGRLRNMQVQSRMIKCIMRETEQRDPEFLEFVRSRKKSAGRRMKVEVSSISAKSLRRECRDIERMARDLSDDVLGDRIQESLVDRSKLMESLLQPGVDSERAHHFRVLLKEINYLRRLTGHHTEEPMLEQAAELLGQWHDCEVAIRLYAEYLKKHPERTNSKLEGAIRDAGDKSFSGAVTLFKQRPGLRDSGR